MGADGDGSLAKNTSESFENSGVSRKFYVAYNDETYKIMPEKQLRNVSFSHSFTIKNKKASVGAFLNTFMPELKEYEG